MRLNYLLQLGLLLTLLASYKTALAQDAVPQRTVFIDQSAMDKTVSPGSNFFLYANGDWIKHTEIPASNATCGSFYAQAEINRNNLRKIVEELVLKNNAKGTADQKVADYYTSGMDTAAIEKLGYAPIKPLLAKIDAIKNYKELLHLAADGYPDGEGFLFSFSVNPDDKISTQNIVTFVQSGLGLPSPDYYFNNNIATQNIRKEYLKYIAKLFVLTGTDQATANKQAEAILKLETSIAQSHSSPTELRDPVKNYNKFAVVDFQKQVPNIDLKNVLDRMLIKVDTLLIGQPKYYQTLSSLLKTQAITIWKAKLKFDALNRAAPVLTKNFDLARFHFYGKILNGRKVEWERWKRVINAVDRGLSGLLGQLYVAHYFKYDAKDRMLAMVNNMQQVYQSRIEKLDWMSAETKQYALAKLQAFIKKIGYPDQWENYDDVSIDYHADHYKNVQSITRHDYQKMIKKLGKPVDKQEWGITTPTANAYYSQNLNEIVFPAGILQPPFFDSTADDGVNYGAIGAVIGHEMTHGFDDKGRQYDKDGNLKDWWTKADADQFNKRAQLVIDQYSKYSVLDSIQVNGNLTLGENIADIGGLAIAYQAFKMTKQGQSNEQIDGLSPDQRFFLSFAQVWRIKVRDEAIRMRISTDPHSPPMHRVNGPLSNMDEFYKAFDIKPGDKMYRPKNERVHIW